ncbi:MAG: hypothetical protein JO364_18955 [Pseudonocardiales bacterium]|nr:hypothetical protein [Pseudonocardiales bacterium]
MPAGGGGEAEAFPPGSAGLTPLGVDVLDDLPQSDLPQSVRAGFPDGAGAIALAVLADFAPGAVGVVPLRVPVPVFPLSGFRLLDDSMRIETPTGVQQLDGPDEVAVHVEAFERLRDAAAIGPRAVALIRRLMDELSG